MKLYGYTPAFSGDVDESLIQRDDVHPPRYLFCYHYEEFVQWQFSGWSAVICVSSIQEAAEIAARLEQQNADASRDVGD